MATKNPDFRGHSHQNGQVWQRVLYGRMSFLEDMEGWMEKQSIHGKRIWHKLRVCNVHGFIDQLENYHRRIVEISTRWSLKYSLNIPMFYSSMAEV